MKITGTRDQLITLVVVVVVLQACGVVAAPGRHIPDDQYALGDDTLGPKDDLSASEIDDVGQTQRLRDDKLFLALVQIQPDQCTTKDGFSTIGTCMPASECTAIGGASSGSCAKGLGVCCLVKKRCSSTSKFNNTYFVNPTDDTTLGACTLTVNRVNANICQLRLDFIFFELSQPDAIGQCSVDFFTVQGMPTMICGSNTNQHMYVNVDPNGGAIKLTVDRSAAAAMNRQWNIKVSQIECNSRFKAPKGCLQYFTETSGSVSSFNYGTSLLSGTRQIRNMDYGVCLLPPDGYCGIIWERDATNINSFTVTGALDALDPKLIGTPYAVGRNCTTDYVIIPGGVEDTGLQNDRFCGLGFPNSVTSYAKPYILYVKTDGDEAKDVLNRGFKLNYRLTTVCT
ncbi:uncharacterized protein LOC122251538 isoform X2 [Penaeus japonicus]|uniref:uncharacterized protein LOC122251538 isoform X2 n=1 Tax=Penaeus japonicus TaxID=27405 RepID=UPI001C7106AD|nr:uncharacterized protein LOC122251538 isoform X2 [Penaeus japonicus]